MVLESPYSDAPLPWLRANFHAHSRNSDGPSTPQGVVDLYAARGYDLLALSDHDQLTDPSVLDARGMVLLPGNEISVGGPHVLHIGAESCLAGHPDRQQVIEAIGAQGGLSIVCHPNWEAHFNHCPQENLEAWRGYTGLEIYNGVVSWLEGNPCATDRWDRLLAGGKRVWGFANDDCHRIDDIGVAWNMVQCERRHATALDALRHGRFYATTGVLFDRIEVDGPRLRVAAQNADHIAIYSDYACRRARAYASEIEFTVPSDASYSYIRVECSGPSAARAWTQPFFLRSDG